MSLPACKYDPDCPNTPNCPMTYSMNSSNPSTHATMTVSGTKMSVNAVNVNKSSVNANNWTVAKQIKYQFTSNNSVTAKYMNVNIKVLPCELNATTITTLTTPIGSKLERTFGGHSFKHGENTTGFCGSPRYEMVGGNSNAYLTFTESTRKLVFWPKTTAYQKTVTHTIKSWCSKFPLNFTLKTF